MDKHIFVRFIFRLLREVVRLRRNTIENDIVASGLRALWKREGEGGQVIPPWDLKEDLPKDMGDDMPTEPEIRAMSEAERFEHAKDLVMQYGGPEDDPPQNPLDTVAEKSFLRNRETGAGLGVWLCAGG